MARQENDRRKNPVIVWGMLSGLFIWLTTVGGLIFQWAKLPPQIPLFYSLPWGEGWLIDKSKLWMILAGFALIWFVNNLLALIVSKQEVLLGAYLAWGSAIIQLLLAVTMLRTVLIVL